MTDNIKAKGETPEEWRDVVGWEGLYIVSNLGNVLSVRSNKIMKPHVTQFGYYRLSMSIRGKHKFEVVHRLVATAFIPNPENKPQVNHKDSNRLNNRLENLEWVTNKENLEHGRKYGNGDNNGERHGRSSLLKTQVIEIKEMLSKNENVMKIANKFGVTKGAIYSIKKQETWKSVK